MSIGGHALLCRLRRYLAVVLALLCAGLCPAAELELAAHNLAPARISASFSGQLLAPELGLDEVRALAPQFPALAADAALNFGYSDQAFWLHTQVQGPAQPAMPWLLELHYPLLDEVDFWLLDDHGQLLKHSRSGDRRALAERELAYRYPMFLLSVEPDRHYQLFIRVYTRGSLQLPLRLHQTETLARELQFDAILIFGYVGALFALSAFNLFLYLALRDRNYLLYVLYILGMGLVVMTLNGITYQWLWPQSPNWANLCLPLLQSLTFVAYVFFSRQFIRLATHYPRLDRILRGCAVAAPVLALSVLFDYRLAALSISLFSTLIALLFIALSWRLWRRHAEASAQYYFIAWLPFVMALVVLFLYFAGTTSARIAPMQWLLLAAMAEMILLALALAARVRLLQNENEQMHAIQQNELSAQVHMRTRELTRANRELSQANKDMEFFAYAMAHDLKAPLRAIIGFGEHLADTAQTKLDGDEQQLLQRIRAGARQLKERIDAIVALAKLSAAYLQHQAVDLSALADEVVQELRSAEPERQVDIQIQPAMIAFGDAALLRTVVQNLLENAWKYSARKLKAEIEFSVSAHESEKIYCVRDNGAGFDMAKAHNLFQPFQRLHSSNEFAGSGIGLANVAKIIQRHQGRIWAEAAVDQGARIYFTLPRM